MKMSAFPLPVAGFPNLATTQLLMSAAGGLNLPTSPNVSSPKELPNVNPISNVARVPGMPSDLSIATGPHPAGGYIPPQLGANMPPGMLDPRILYSALSGGYDMKENADVLMAWRQIAAQAQQAASAGVLSYDAHAAAMAAASFSYPAYPSIDLNGARRKNATRETTSTLKAWLYEHRKNPYPTKGEKIMLAIMTKMTLTQVSTWFANARRRLKKENKMTWSPRNRTDDGSSVDDEDKPDNEDGIVGDDDDVSIDLSDFENENSSSQKQSTSALPSSIALEPSPRHLSASSPDGESTKPRIWSIADVAANKPSTSPAHIPIHQQPTSVRHRPYHVPNNTAFRPWFDSSYRHIAGNPAAAAVLSNPLISGSRPTTTPSLRVPHLSSTAAPHSISPPSSSSSSSDSPQAVRAIKAETSQSSKRPYEGHSTSPHSKVSKHDQER